MKPELISQVIVPASWEYSYRARNADTCQLISDQIRERIVNGRECERLYKKLTRERDEAREAARALWNRKAVPDSACDRRPLEVWPWLKETT